MGGQVNVTTFQEEEGEEEEDEEEEEERRGTSARAHKTTLGVPSVDSSSERLAQPAST